MGAHTLGCFDAVGVVNGHMEQNVRLGQTERGWGVRMYGNHSSTEHYGCMHNNEHQPFYRDWTPGDRIGLLYRPSLQTLSVYRNGFYLGTPFTNVHGAIYPCVEMCHVGSMT